jgi:hypothetical protein
MQAESNCFRDRALPPALPASQVGGKRPTSSVSGSDICPPRRGSGSGRRPELHSGVSVSHNGEPTKSSDKSELRGDDVNDTAEPSLPGKLQAALGFTLDLREQISRSEKVRVQGVAAVT